MTTLTEALQTDPFDLLVWVGKSWAIEITYCEPDGETIIPLTGWSARGQIREYPDGPLCANFTFDVDEDNATILVTLTPADTRTIVKGAVYDIELVSGDAVVGLMHGDVHTIPEVTKP